MTAHNRRLRNRNLLAIALVAALLSPIAWAGKDKPVRDTADQHEPQHVTKGATEQTRPTPPPSPPQSQGAEHAAGHSSVAQRDVWGRLDTNGDGRISAAESAVDVGFNDDFAIMDTDRDGFVSDSEYRLAAKDEGETRSATGGIDAASHSSAGVRDAMSRLDANADGSISLGESARDATIQSSFATIDANSDGMVSDTEYRAWLKAERK